MTGSRRGAGAAAGPIQDTEGVEGGGRSRDPESNRVKRQCEVRVRHRGILPPALPQ